MYTISISTPDAQLIRKITDITDSFSVKSESESKPVEKEKKVKAATAPLQETTPITTAAPAPSKELSSAVKEAVLALVKISKQTGVAVLSQFGVAKISELKSEQYEAFLKAANEVLASQEAADLTT